MRNFHQFLVEVSAEDLQKVSKRTSKFSKGKFKDEPFNNIFGNKLRIVVPITDNEERDFTSTLLSHGFNPDLKKGIVSYSVKTEKGDKTREEKIGKLLQRMKTKEPNVEYWEEMLHWWEKNRSNVGKIAETGISIIVSRSPIDIVRMSDWRELHSCHAPGGSYYKCVFSEAKYGGAVAYIVKTNDLKKIKDLQAEEIFEDKSRGIDGVEPLERIRLKRFESGDKNLLVPTTTTYGIKHIGFYDTVKNWALSVQNIDLKNPPDFSKYNLRGGSYVDGGTITPSWNKFFDTNATGNKTSLDKEKEGKSGELKPDELYARAEQQLEAHQRNWKHFSCWFDVDEAEGHVYLGYRGNVRFSFPEKEFEKPLKFGRDYSAKRKLEKKIESSLDIYAIDSIEFDNHEEGKVNIDVSFYQEDEFYQGETQLEKFEFFLDDIDDYDKKYQKNYGKVQQILINEGYLKDWREQYQDFNFKHFKYDDNPPKKSDGPPRVGDFTEFVSEPMWIGDLREVVGSAMSTELSIEKELKGKIFPKSFSTDIFIDKKSLKVFLTLHAMVVNNNAFEFRKAYYQTKLVDNNFDYYYRQVVRWFDKFKSVLSSTGSTNAFYSPQKEPQRELRKTPIFTQPKLFGDDE